MYREGDSIKLQDLKSQESSLNEEMKASVDFGWQKKKRKKLHDSKTGEGNAYRIHNKEYIAPEM